LAKLSSINNRFYYNTSHIPKEEQVRKFFFFSVVLVFSGWLMEASAQRKAQMQSLSQSMFLNAKEGNQELSLPSVDVPSNSTSLGPAAAQLQRGGELPSFSPMQTLDDQADSTTTSNQSLVALAVMAVPITVALLETDQETHSALYHWKRSNPTVSKLSPIVTQLGEGTTSVGLFGGMFLYGTFADSRSEKQAGIIGLESFVVSGFTTQLLKHLFSRERPSAATRQGGRFQRPFSYFRQRGGEKRGYANFDAFPSGHTATAFAAATTLSDIYQKPWVPYVAYGTATAVAISRITERAHWASDCFVGALIGIFSTKAVEWFNGQMYSVSVCREADSEEAGISFSVRF
jgi:membrane-associated phospholipid phosphatase